MLAASTQGKLFQQRLMGGDGHSSQTSVRARRKARKGLQVQRGEERKRAADAICWEPLHNLPCRCNGDKLHLERMCAAHVKRLISGVSTSEECPPECSAEEHVDLDTFKQTLQAWWGAEWSWVGSSTMATLPKPMVIPALANCPDAELLGVGKLPDWSQVQFWQTEIETRHSENEHLRALVLEPWFEAMLRTPGGGKLWGRSGRRRVLKELSESYGVLTKLKGNVDCSDGGCRVVYFDVCSGKGLTTLMLSFALPAAQLVMLDSDTEMDLSHLRGPVASQLVQLYNVDIFTTTFPSLLCATAAAAPHKSLVLGGTHLCGALSPRLLAVFREVVEASLLILSPCCLKGWLGKQVQTRAAEQQRVHYEVLCEEIAAMLQPEDGMVDNRNTWVEFDENVLSPKNGFILSKRMTL